MRNRSWRRHQRQRKLKRVKDFIRSHGWYTKSVEKSGEDIERSITENALKICDNPVTCSSYCCGNPRKWFGTPTMAERRRDIDDED